MANETMRLSAAGMTKLRFYEGVRDTYYDDSANNCTVGIGELAHYGPCTPREKATSVTNERIQNDLVASVRRTETTVRRYVNRQPMTQDQFDALVTHCFNMGPAGTRTLLDAANRGSYDHVAHSIKSRIFYHPRDKFGRRLAAVRSRGLATRREQEAAPFRQMLHTR